MKAAIGIIVVAMVGMAGCANVKDRQAHREAQIRMVEKQMLAKQQMQVQMAQAQAAWATAMAEVARTNPDSADAIAVGLAVAASKNNEAANDSGPVVTLQRETNDAQEWAKILAGPVLQTVGLVATTAINADVQKNASDNMAKINIQQNEIEGRQFEALAGVANAVTTFGQNALDNAGGNTTYNMDGESLIDMSTDSSVNTTTTNNTTDNSTSVADSYNDSSSQSTSNVTNTTSNTSTTTSATDSYNDSSDSSTDSSDNSNNSDNSDNTDNSGAP